MRGRTRSWRWHGQFRVPALLAPLLLSLILAINHCHAIAGVFGQRKKAQKDTGEGGSAEEAASATGAGFEPTTTGHPIEKNPPNEQPVGNFSKPARPPSVIEAEARTARELAQAVGKLRKDLKTCTVRVDAIEEGFQSLYAAHLGNIDGLRKCKEGVLTKEDLEKLDASLDSVNPALVEQAQAKEVERRRRERTEALAEKHRDLINKLEDQVEQLVRREKTWERTISELVARRDLLEKREGAWERTIGDLMADIEIRAKRESWWEEMKVEMEGRIGALSQTAVIERFGPGPHFVSVMVMLEEGNPSSQDEIVIQLAPLELVPHSIHLFLTQIAEGYWSRGTPAIAMNAEHVLQACPHPCLDGIDLGGSIQFQHRYSDMRAAGLDTVSFQEYSPQFPHKKYTVGFAGMPHSGPEFFINLMDNTLDHGTVAERKKMMNPDVYKIWAEEVFGGGEEVLEKVVEPFPCFGKVIRGLDVVDEIAKQVTRASLPREEGSAEEVGGGQAEIDESILISPVKIVSVNILKDHTPGDSGSKAHVLELSADEL